MEEKKELKVIKVKSVSDLYTKGKQANDKLAKNDNRYLWATIAALYPQYTLKQASELSLRDISLLLRVKRRKDAEFLLKLSDVVARPYMDKAQQRKLVSALEEDLKS